MTNQQVRVRFAPSPTGGLHLGGVRTLLFNYLFAKKNKGKFIIRIEDTDQTRFVDKAEEYIFDCLKWCGLEEDESVQKGGAYAPYRQSERKQIYGQYALQLVEQGRAYYAFDTPEELEQMRERLKSEHNPMPQYDHHTRFQMRNSLSLTPEETNRLLANNTPYVIRIKINENEVVHFNDLIRGDIEHSTSVLDDKVLLKADGMPTYHLAVVVDDYLMQISHVLRGEEWLPSAPVHVLLWDYLGWKDQMPKWAHLPLILKPDGNGKLSKRDGERLGFPVYAMDWKDPNTGEIIHGFKENGFLPEAFINMLALLGWHPGDEREILSLEELSDMFSLERIQKSGAKFDYEKAKWYNQQYIHKMDNAELAKAVLPFLKSNNIDPDLNKLDLVVSLVKERCQLLSDFVIQAGYFFCTPSHIDTDAIASKWNEDKRQFFESWMLILQDLEWNGEALQQSFEETAINLAIKKGEIMLPLRIMLVGGKFGPGVFEIMELIGKDEALLRINNALGKL